MEKVVFLDISGTSIPHTEVMEFKRLAKLAIFNAKFRSWSFSRAVNASKTRKKINGYRKKLKF